MNLHCPDAPRIISSRLGVNQKFTASFCNVEPYKIDRGAILLAQTECLCKSDGQSESI